MDYHLQSALVPSYLLKYNCTGPKCKDSCCKSWSIGVDKETYNKYLKIETVKKSPIFTKHIHRIPSDNANSYNYAYIEMVDGVCPFLTNKGLCKIHSDYGAEYLIGSCNTYPRIVNILNDFCEISGLLSCPEIARLVLLNTVKIEFQSVVIKNYLKNTLFISTILDFNTRKGQWAFYTLAIRDFTIDVLQERSCSLMDRLTFLGLFFQETQKAVESSQIESIPHLISQHFSMINSGDVRNISASIKPNIQLQYLILKEISEIRIIDCPLYEDFLLKIFNGIGYSPHNSLDTNIDNYLKVYREYYHQYMAEKEYILENYLVNFVFNSVFPYSENNNDIFESYIVLVVIFSLLQFHLVGMAGFIKSIDDELVVNTVYLFSRFFRHDRSFFNKIYRLLNEKSLSSFAHMILLLKAPVILSIFLSVVGGSLELLSLI